MTKAVGYTDEPITKIEPKNIVVTGIQWGSLGVEMVPIFEEQSARLERGFSIQSWIDMDPIERAMIVAIRRIDNSMKNIQADAEIAASKKGSKK